MKNQTPVCRSVSVQIQNKDEWTKRQNPFVQVKSVPGDREVPVSRFVEAVLPGKAIEFLGRETMKGVSSYKNMTPSSLFFQAVHEAFAKHYPLALRPEVLMYLICHEVATAVKLHPEDYRSLFTTTEGKETIEIRHDSLRRGDPMSPWSEALALFDPALRERVPAGIMKQMLPVFSTATPETTAASMIVFMDAASPFYDYRVDTLCGLPEIRLLGTAKDYQKILAAARELAKLFGKHLGLYFQHLLPVLETLAEQAAGAPIDDLFWKSIYKFNSRSGGSRFNGWITAFLNYIQTPEFDNGFDSSKGGLVQKDERLFDWNPEERISMPGLSIGSVPSHVSAVPFVWNYFETEIPMTFIGGVLGIDVEDGYLTPVLSFGVLE